MEGEVTELKVKSSGFALVDITTGRAKLAKELGGSAGYHGDKATHKIPVTLKGFIVEQYSGDDSVSREFLIDVDSIKLGKKVKAKP